MSCVKSLSYCVAYTLLSNANCSMIALIRTLSCIAYVNCVNVMLCKCLAFDEAALKALLTYLMPVLNVRQPSKRWLCRL